MCIVMDMRISKKEEFLKSKNNEISKYLYKIIFIIIIIIITLIIKLRTFD